MIQRTKNNYVGVVFLLFRAERRLLKDNTDYFYMEVKKSLSNIYFRTLIESIVEGLLRCNYESPSFFRAYNLFSSCNNPMREKKNMCLVGQKIKEKEEEKDGGEE